MKTQIIKHNLKKWWIANEYKFYGFALWTCFVVGAAVMVWW